MLYNANPSEVLSDDERQTCEVWTRVMGYHRPVSEFNKGKKVEHAERKCFVERFANEQPLIGMAAE
ncbi:MAG: hypothetical protein KAJ75_00235 [Alphaproteobacteria bacterium]|nr:hypothetical protein [Alphaproteobacteria bacterium]